MRQVTLNFMYMETPKSEEESNLGRNVAIGAGVTGLLSVPGAISAGIGADTAQAIMKATPTTRRATLDNMRLYNDISPGKVKTRIGNLLWKDMSDIVTRHGSNPALKYGVMGGVVAGGALLGGGLAYGGTKLYNHFTQPSQQ